MNVNYKKDNIVSIEIDDSGRLHIKPEKSQYTLIYRTATEVHWDRDKQTLYSPKPRDWTYLDWFLKILSVIKSEYFTELQLTENTRWINIPQELKKEIIKS